MGLHLCIKQKSNIPVSVASECDPALYMLNFFPQIFNRLVAVFDFALRNLSEGRISVSPRVGWSITLRTLVHFKREIGTAKERLDAIAQSVTVR